MVSVGVRRTSVGLSAAVWSFLVEFDCWFGESPTDSLAGKSVGLTSPTNMHRKVTGKSPDNSSHSRAKNLAFWIGRVRWSPTGVRPEKGGECKDLKIWYIHMIAQKPNIELQAEYWPHLLLKLRNRVTISVCTLISHNRV